MRRKHCCIRCGGSGRIGSFTPGWGFAFTCPRCNGRGSTSWLGNWWDSLLAVGVTAACVAAFYAYLIMIM